MLLVDEPSGNFGSAEQLKMMRLQQKSRAFGIFCHKNNDKVGLIVFTDKIEKFIPPKRN